MATSRNVTRFRHLEEYAQDLLKAYEKRFSTSIRPPIPVEAIAKQLLNLQLQAHDLSDLVDGIDGALLTADDVVFIDEDYPSMRRRFTISHEIAHWVFHHLADKSVDRAVNSTNSSEAEKSSKEMFDEKDADRLAGALLIPYGALRHEAEKYEVIDAEAVHELAEVFRVSTHAMLTRIRYLWDFFESVGRAIDWNSLDHLHTAMMNRRTRLELQRSASANDLPRYNVDPMRHKPDSMPPIVWNTVQQLMQMGIGFEHRLTSSREPWAVTVSPSEKLKRPFVIEIAGTPNAGKDTQIRILADYLRKIRGYKVQVKNDEYVACPLVGCAPVDKLYWVIGKVFQNFMELLDQPPKYDVVIFNRGLFDVLAFLRFYRKLGLISEKDEKDHSRSLLCRKLRNLIDIVFLLDIPPHVAIHRENQASEQTISYLANRFDWLILSEPLGSLENEEDLELLNVCYEEVYERYHSSFRSTQWHLQGGDHSINVIAEDLLAEVDSDLPPKQYVHGHMSRLAESPSTPSAEQAQPMQLVIPGM